MSLTVVCPSCGEETAADATFCEACGHELDAEPRPACVNCGAREVGEDGYCMACGHKQPEERDHQQFVDGVVAAVTDRGKRHRHNEDAVAIAELAGGGGILVVCDGVSSTSGSAEASLRAATAARDLLVLGLGPEEDESGSADPAELLVRATEAAQVEAAASAESAGSPEPEPNATTMGGAPGGDGGSPSSTFVAVVATPVAEGVSLTTAWVGDSRAYWVGSEPQRLTGKDHELGGSLVRWLGADTINATPDVATTVVPAGGHVVVCSDGLWRYAAEPEELSDLVARYRSDGLHGVDLASALVDHANQQGGHDNISVALWTDDPVGDAPAAEPGPDETDGGSTT